MRINTPVVVNQPYPFYYKQQTWSRNSFKGSCAIIYFHSLFCLAGYLVCFLALRPLWLLVFSTVFNFVSHWQGKPDMVLESKLFLAYKTFSLILLSLSCWPYSCNFGKLLVITFSFAHPYMLLWTSANRSRPQWTTSEMIPRPGSIKQWPGKIYMCNISGKGNHIIGQYHVLH